MVFRCVRCQAWVTRPVREVPLSGPDEGRARYEMEDGQECPPRMAPGTFAVNPELAGRPYVESSDDDGRTVLVPGGPRNSIVLCPADVRSVQPIHGKGRRNGCCGPDSMDGPNLACADCRAEVATEFGDCWTWQQVVLVPTAVELFEVPHAWTQAAEPDEG